MWRRKLQADLRDSSQTRFPATPTHTPQPVAARVRASRACTHRTAVAACGSSTSAPRLPLHPPHRRCGVWVLHLSPAPAPAPTSTRAGPALELHCGSHAPGEGEGRGQAASPMWREGSTRCVNHSDSRVAIPPHAVRTVSDTNSQW
jgi:hypothetical protein